MALELLDIYRQKHEPQPKSHTCYKTHRTVDLSVKYKNLELLEDRRKSSVPRTLGVLRHDSKSIIY